MSEPSSTKRTPASADRVAVTSLQLQDLRNYATLTVAFDAQLVALVGENGVGKTNLLEAVSLLAPGRGLRRAPFEEIARRGSAGRWSVSAVIRRDDGETRIGTGLAGESLEGFVRRVRINAATAFSPDALLDHLRVLWLTPAMDGLFLGPAAERRRFMDRLVLTVDAAHARRTRDFDRLLTQRNRLLAEGASAAWLDAVEAELAGNAVAVALARAETAALLSARVAKAESGGFTAVAIQLAGKFDRAVATRKAAEAEMWYRDALARGRAEDRAASRTLLGPHRTDLQVLFAEKDMPAALSSTGEQKALLIGMMLAHTELVAEIASMTPVLLLDEVAAHLDPRRRSALFGRLADLGAQVFVTGTDMTLFQDLPCGSARYRVTDGRLDLVG